ncbi:MAG: GGDEF domain-containing protein [Jaaginema sp. PMC 1079.18]|nr:GGDEF domain-containing protein [Jaaginema sp. PMC 1080.18]MEC4849547.1 GGDEF domain-containing protein [Jaaginema sp. PMC 1079.18]
MNTDSDLKFFDLKENFLQLSSVIPEVRQIQIFLLKTLAILVYITLPFLSIADSWQTGTMTIVDQIGYIAVLASYGLAFILLSFLPRLYFLAATLSTGAFALYLELLIQSIIWGYDLTANPYMVGTIMQWFPLLYVICFIFFKGFYANFFSITFYLSLLISLSIRASLDWQELSSDEFFPFYIQFLCCHPLYIALFNWIGKIKKAYATSYTKLKIAQKFAATDVLTGINNRRTILAFLEQAISSDNQAQKNTAVCLLDLDYFKAVNDTYGHDIGDFVLMETAQILQQNIRPGDCVGRWGGEEFIIVLPATSLVEAQPLIEELRYQIAHHTFKSVNRVTGSFGLAISQPQDTVKTLTKNADVALYKAKHFGRNRVEIYEVQSENFA